MMLRKWEDLPQEMRTEEVRPYYDLLRKKQGEPALQAAVRYFGTLVLLVLLSPVFWCWPCHQAGLPRPGVLQAGAGDPVRA